MREYLSAYFHKIYVLNLHGDTNKREKAPNGGPDKNVFDIQQGVAIIIGIRRADGEKCSPAVADFYGLRAVKNKMLYDQSISTLSWSFPIHAAPYFFYSTANFKNPVQYSKGFSIDDLVPENLSGAVTGNDRLYVGYEKGDLINHQDGSLIRDFLYRPLDRRQIYFDKTKLQRARNEIFVHLIRGPNMALISPRQALEGGGANVFDNIIGHKTFSAYNRNYVFPLFCYPDVEAGQASMSILRRTLNFDAKIYALICKAANLTPSPDVGEGDAFRTATGADRPAEVKVFDYIYGVLHSPAYRATYAEFLKIDFPRIPYPPDAATFAHVSAKGEVLRRLHLMEPGAIGDTPYPYLGDGDDVVTTGYPKFENSCVKINADQYFDGVPALAWSFHIGGYQPAQKWLKDRRGRIMSYDDIGHYQKIVKILVETDRIMKEIVLPLDRG